MYQHLVPRAVYHLANRAEFLTAYTPYQAEISQGVLQATFEYQTLICSLTGMDVANASMYDGATALAEAALMAINITNGSRVIAFESIHPDYRAVVETYLRSCGGRVSGTAHRSRDRRSGSAETVFRERIQRLYWSSSQTSSACWSPLTKSVLSWKMSRRCSQLVSIPYPWEYSRLRLLWCRYSGG